MKIVQATRDHIDDLVPLFDGYRIFYKQESDFNGVKKFLSARIQNNESIIYLAYINDKAVGFTQLYPLFSSVSIKPMYLLNDLFVDQSIRGKGVGEALIKAAKDLCRNENNKGMAIQTAPDNPAQNLYQRLGFIKDVDLQFFWMNDKSS
tara:strand:- start:477 stop:923 length:447 start_codon:yes stop_codon:yes gene_type:complete